MKKTVLSTVLYSILASFVTASGMLLCIALANGVPSGVGGWNLLFSLPEHVVIIIAIVLITLDIACVALAVMLIISGLRGRAALRETRRERKKTRFSRLKELDTVYADKKAVSYEEPSSLAELCDRFRDYAASEMGLYYEKDVVRSYIASLAVTHLTIMQGISGTGKTSLAYAFGRFSSPGAVMSPVQPSWKDRTDLLGYYNEFTDTYTETELLCKLYEANLCDDVYTVVLDEMNIARVEYYFAEFLSLLELPEGPERRLRVTSDSRDTDPALFSGGTLALPGNVWFVGTANNDDSTLAVSDKVYDRAFVIDLEKRAKPFDAPATPPMRISATALKALFSKAAESHAVTRQMTEKIEELDEYLMREFRITFGNRVLKQIERFVPVFVACGGDELTAVDMILCRKVLRKLESLNPVYVRASADGLVRRINELFGQEKMPECKNYMLRFKER